MAPRGVVEFMLLWSIVPILSKFITTAVNGAERETLMQLILYSKPGCHLCEGLLEKLAAVTNLQFELEVRDITTQEAWFEAYQYEIPVLCWVSPTGPQELPRLSPRAPVARLEQLLATHCQ